MNWQGIRSLSITTVKPFEWDWLFTKDQQVNLMSFNDFKRRELAQAKRAAEAKLFPTKPIDPRKNMPRGLSLSLIQGGATNPSEKVFPVKINASGR